MKGQIHLSSVNLGTTFTTADGREFALCNGQSFPRATYFELSEIWPVGTYGSDASNIHLPNLSNIYIRGHDYSRGVAHDPTKRIALSGVAPSGVQIGSYQVANMASHVHPSGSSAPFQFAGSGGPVFGVTGASATPITSTSLGFDDVIAHVQGDTDDTDFDLAHTKAYPYICLR